MTEARISVTLNLEKREDGGLRVYSDELPGLILSHSDPGLVLIDVGVALKALLLDRFLG